MLCCAGGVGVYLVLPDDSDEYVEDGTGAFCFYTLCPTLTPGLTIHGVKLRELETRGQHYGVKGLITRWLKDYGSGYKQASRPGFLLGVTESHWYSW